MAESSNQALSHKLAGAGALSIAGKIVGRILDLVTLVVLSRLLTPAEFGLVALATTVITISEALTTLPLAQAMLDVENPRRDVYDTAFTLTFIRGVALALVLCLLALFFAHLYHEPRLAPLILALSLAPILRGLASPRMTIFLREMDFRFEIGIETFGKVCAFAVSTAIAFSTHSYWAIASATISTPLVVNLFSYIFAPYVPRFTLSEWPLFRNVIGWNTLAQFFSALNWQIDRLLLGYTASQADLGRYSVASNMSGIPIQAVVVPLANPLLVAYTRRSDKGGGKMAATYLKASNAVLAISAPVLLGQALLAVPALRLILGPSWKEAAILLQWFALINIITLPVSHLAGLSLSLRKLQMYAWRTFGEFAIATPILFLGNIYYGIPGIIVARGISMFIVLAIGMEAVRRLTTCSLLSQILALRRTVGALVMLAGVVLLLRPFISDDNLFVLFLELVLVSFAGASAYVVSLYVFWQLEGQPDGIEKVALEKFGSLFGSVKILNITNQ